MSAPTPSQRAFRRHAWAYAAGAGALIAANWAGGGPWWSFWPVAAWSLAFVAHYLVYKARHVDERWVEERAADLRSRSYDAGHIDAIKKDAERRAPP